MTETQTTYVVATAPCLSRRILDALTEVEEANRIYHKAHRAVLKAKAAESEARRDLDIANATLQALNMELLALSAEDQDVTLDIGF